MKNKLFVWKDVLYDYTGGVMFALAPDVETARALLKEEMHFLHNDLMQEPEVIEVNTKYAHYVYGGG